MLSLLKMKLNSALNHLTSIVICDCQVMLNLTRFENLKFDKLLELVL